MIDNSIEDFVKRIKQKPLKQVIQVTDDGIEMRLLKMQDKDKLFATVMKNKEFLSKVLPWANSYQTVQDSISFLTFFEGCHNEVSKIGYMIWQNDNIIGSIAFQELDLDKKQAEIGYWLDQDANGKGIMTKCVVKLIEYGFSDLELEKIIIRCIVSNLKSASIPIRIGFKEVEQQKNSIQINGEFHDSRVFWLTLEDYSKINQQQK